MDRSLVPPLVAGFVAIAISVAHRLTVVLVELSIHVPSPRVLTLFQLGGRFVGFVLVYGLLFGLAYWVGMRGDDSSADGPMALATGVVSAFAYLVGSVALLFLVDTELSVFVSGLAVLGSSAGLGVQFAVVTFAGVALARR